MNAWPTFQSQSILEVLNLRVDNVYLFEQTVTVPRRQLSELLRIILSLNLKSIIKNPQVLWIDIFPAVDREISHQSFDISTVEVVGDDVGGLGKVPDGVLKGAVVVDVEQMIPGIIDCVDRDRDEALRPSFDGWVVDVCKRFIITLSTSTKLIWVTD